MSTRPTKQNSKQPAKRASAAHPSPTEADWAQKKPIIESLYLKGTTLKDTAVILAAEHDFHCTERQYKGKISSWGFPKKRLKIDTYQAMNTIGAYCSSYGRNISFLARKGDQDRSIVLSQIRKELNRKGSSQIAHVNILDEKRIRSALSQLRAESIRITTNGVTVSPEWDVIFDFCHQYRPTNTVLAPTSNGVIVPQEQAHAGSAHSGHESVPDATIAIPRAWQGQGHQASQSNQRNDPLWINATAAQNSSYDIDDILGGVSSFQLLVDTDPGHRSNKAGIDTNPTRIPTLDATYDPEKAAARQWAFPFFLHCFRVPDGGEGSVEFDNSLAMSELRKMLRTDRTNKYIFVLLNWMVCILHFNGKNRALDPFLRASLEAIETTLGPQSPFQVVFQYALAFVRNDFVGQMEWGSKLMAAQRDIEDMCGMSHANSIVNLYYWATYCLRQGQTHIALGVLQSCQSRVERVMNPDYLLTIQCMALRARVYAQMRRHYDAIQTVQEALNRFHYQSELLVAYRLDLVHLLALSQKEVGNLVLAERLLRDVVQERVNLIGLLTFGAKSMTLTWEAIFDLENVLKLQGRHEQAQQVVRQYQDLYYVELGRQASPEASPRPPESDG